jgi:nicotinamide riboside transporter PnuC
MLFLFSSISIWFISRREKWKRWGYIIGLCGQPFWFYSAFTTKQYGIVLLSVFYTYSWIQGIYNYWIKKNEKIQNN